jgi:hypothetical protein
MLYDLAAGESLWSRFNAPREQIVWYNREMIARAAQDDPQLQNLAAECRELLHQLEQHAK